MAKNQRKKRIKKEAKAYITEPIQEEILHHLPVKSLIRLQSVCRSWRALIRSPSFIDRHRRRHRLVYSDQLLVSDSSSAATLTPLSPATDPVKLALSPSGPLLPPKMTRLYRPRSDPAWRPNYRVLGPLANGFYCVVSYLLNEVTPISVRRTKVALCNPAIRDYKLTSRCPLNSERVLSEPRLRPYQVHYGFGTVSSPTNISGPIQDYKVVVVVTWGSVSSDTFMAFVYSFGVGKWRKIVDFERGLYKPGMENYPEIVQDLEVCPQRFFQGCWHWMAMGTNGDYSLVSFNFVDDEFELMAGPPGYYDYDPDEQAEVMGGVLVLNDHLAAIYVLNPETYDESQCIGIDIWMMMEYGVVESWIKIYATKPVFDGWVSRLVGISLRDHDIRRVFLEDENKQVISCDASGCQVHVDVTPISSLICWNTLGVSTYMETLERLT